MIAACRERDVRRRRLREEERATPVTCGVGVGHLDTFHLPGYAVGPFLVTNSDEYSVGSINYYEMLPNTFCVCWWNVEGWCVFVLVHVLVMVLWRLSALLASLTSPRRPDEAPHSAEARSSSERRGGPGVGKKHSTCESSMLLLGDVGDREQVT